MVTLLILFIRIEDISISANLNSVFIGNQESASGAVRPAKLMTFTNRPDERWQHTVYDMDGNKIWK